jgi:hypothetical protein
LRESYGGRRVGLEAKSLHSTIQDIRVQEPCERAESLRKASGISDAANDDGTCWIKSAKVTSTL